MLCEISYPLKFFKVGMWSVRRIAQPHRDHPHHVPQVVVCKTTNPGQREQSEIGLYYYNARWYDSALGRFTSPDTIIPGAGNPLAWDRFSYVQNNPTRYTDPSGHLACDAEHVAEGDCSDWVRPKMISNWDNVFDDPVELMTRAMLSEEGIKFGTEKHDDVIGVGWAIRNRHDLVYFDQNYDDEEDQFAWRNAAVSEVHGMATGLAYNPSENWQKYFDSGYELFVAYNNLREAAQEIISSDIGLDITFGATHWADAHCIGPCIDYDRNGEYENIALYERTHFYNWNSNRPAHCVITVPNGQCR